MRLLRRVSHRRRISCEERVPNMSEGEFVVSRHALEALRPRMRDALRALMVVDDAESIIRASEDSDGSD